MEDSIISTSRVRTIMKSSPDVTNISSEAVYCMGKVAELFVVTLAKRAAEQANDAGEVTYEHVAECVQNDMRMFYLHEVIPRKVKVSDIPGFDISVLQMTDEKSIWFYRRNCNGDQLGHFLINNNNNIRSDEGIEQGDSRQTLQAFLKELNILKNTVDAQRNEIDLLRKEIAVGKRLQHPAILNSARYPRVKFRNFTEKKRILITGGSGFVGSHLVDQLLLDGHQVICVDNHFTGQKRNIERWIGHPNFELISHDISNPLYLTVDQIYHLASPASPPHYMFNPVKTIKTNTLGTINVLGLARRNRAKILLASTSEVYGDPVVHPQPETYWGNVNPIGPRSCYDEGKRVAEALMVAYHKQEAVDIRIARIFNTFGPRMNMNDGRVVSNFILQALENRSITVYGSGQHTRSFQYVSDLVSGLIKLMESNVTVPVNFGNPEEHTIAEFALMVKNLTKCKCEIVHHESSVDDPQRRKPNITRAWQLLQWKPKYDYRVPPMSQHPFSISYHPFPGRNGVVLSPQFPLTHQFSNGLQYGSGGGYYQRGRLNIPFLKWGAIWNKRSLLTAGGNAPWYNYGHMVQPTNSLGLRPAEITKMMMDPLFNEARITKSGRVPIPVSNLPGDYNPAYCQPPFCNPFTHTFGIGIMHQESKNFEIDGLLDFPVPTGSFGQGIRFPLSGNGYFGPFPASLFYGHHVHPVNPFPRLGKDWLAKAKLLTR
ncbi:UDP-glucuronic acid decarboxylase 1 [Trichinella zimbabwensis]|uniref:UDP-glucuronate decarboxylase n=1 Tax=Trichinella zimbabwensis TaxID=268475 RepID=A0A0V1HTE8_9BILA|nr:UDP-glucuronic acid decarboxylase 1 [Trichinella zimbabwensis]